MRCFRLLARFFEHRLDFIERSQCQIDQTTIDPDLPIAYAIECRLEIVSERSKRLKSEHRAGTLDGMQSAKCAAQQFLIAVILIQFQQRGFEIDGNLSR